MANKPTTNLFSQLSKPPEQPRTINQNNSSNALNTGATIPASANPNNVPIVSRRRPLRSHHSSLLHENIIDNFFTDLYQFLKSSQTRTRIQAEIVSSNAIKKWIRMGLDEFKPDTARNADYERQYKAKPFLKLSPEELGFTCATLVNDTYSQKIDSVLSKAIEVLSKELGTNAWTAAKIVRRFLREGQFYPGLYTSQIVNQVFKPNPKRVDRYFLSTDQNIVNQNCLQFQCILAKCIDLYFNQFYSCIFSLANLLSVKFQESQEQGRRGLPWLLLNDRNERSIGRILWENYCSLADTILSVSSESTSIYGDTSSMVAAKKKMRDAIFKRKLIVLNYIVKLFLKVADSNDSVTMNAYGQIEGFWDQVITKIDQHIVTIEASDRFNSQNASHLTRQLTELLLVLFPWNQFYRDSASRDSKRIIEKVSRASSDPFKPIQFLLVDIGCSKPKGDALQRMNSWIGAGEWAVHNYQWKKWLGLFLRCVKQVPLAKYQNVLRHVIWLCKDVMKTNYIQFWQIVQNKFDKEATLYLKQISNFIGEIVSDAIKVQSRGRNFVTITDLLPVLTASIGTLAQNKTGQLMNFLTRDVFQQYIITNIIAALNLDDRRSEKNTRIVYIDEEKQNSIEQQLKLLCRMIQLNCDQLHELEEYISQRDLQGFSLVVLLCRIFQRLEPQSVQDLKCLRYVIKALDSVFVNVDTRTMLPTALGATESTKWSYSKVIKRIVDMCSNLEGSSEITRQTRKLRTAFTTHIHNILIISNSLDQYFPSGSRREDDKNYEKLEIYLKRQDDLKIKEDFLLAKPAFKAVYWLHHMLLILSSSQLTMIDLQNINQLIFKFRVDKWAAREYANLNIVLEILNNGRVAEYIAQVLTPSILNDSNSEKYLFGLANARFEGFMARRESLELTLKSGSTAPKYASKHYRIVKAQKLRNQQLYSLYGEISSSLRVIATVLKIQLEGDYELVRKLKLTDWIINSFATKGFLYTVPFTVKLEQSREQDYSRNQKKPRVPKLVEHELVASVNLLHTITSLLDFETRFQVNQEYHSSSRLKPKGIYFYDTSVVSEGYEIDSSVVVRAQRTILNKPEHNDSISVSVLQIIEFVILLGMERQAYLSITNRSYPQNKATGNSSMATNILNSFLMTLMNILSRPSSRIRLKQVCLQFLSTCLKSARFSQLVRVKASQFKEPFVSCLERLEDRGGLAMMARLLMFLNLLLGSRPGNEDIRFVKGCLGDLSKFGERLSLICRKKFRQLRHAPESDSLFMNLLWYKVIEQSILCRMLLLLYLGILSVLLTTEQEYSAGHICSWVLSESQIFLYPVPPITAQQLDSLGTDCLRIIGEQSALSLQKGYLQFAQNLYKWLLLDTTRALGQQFISTQCEVYHRAEEREVNDPHAYAIKSLRYNAFYSLQKSQDALSQFYCTVLLGLLQRGSHGHYFFQGKQEYSKQLTHQIHLSVHSPNGLAGLQIMAKSEDFARKAFILIKDIISDIWGSQRNQQLQVSKNSAVLLLCQLMASLGKLFVSDPSVAGMYFSDASRLIDRLQADLASGSRERVGQQALFCLIGSMMQFSQAVYIIVKINNLNGQLMRRYFESILQGINNCVGRIGNMQILKLQHMFLDQQASNLLALESEANKVKHYLGVGERKQLMEQVHKGMQMAVHILDNAQSNEWLKSLSMQLFSKVFQIDSFTRDYNVQSRSHQLSHRLSNRMERMIHDQGDSELISGVFLAHLLAEATSIRPNQWTTTARNLLNANAQKMLRRVSNCGSTQSLWGLLQAKYIYCAMTNIQSEQNWRNHEVGNLLTEFFIHIQNSVQGFDGTRVRPSTDFQSSLALRKVIENEEERLYSPSYRSIFQILVELRLHELVRQFLLFLVSSLQHCPLLADFCEKTISTGPLNDQTWEILKKTLQNICDFLVSYSDNLKKGVKSILQVNRSVCMEACFIEMPLRAFFQMYKNQDQLLQESVETILILCETGTALTYIWKSYDWKSRLDWKPSRKSFLVKLTQTANKWLEISKKLGYERQLLKEKITRLNELVLECDAYD